MNLNLGTWERVLRVFVGIVLLGLAMVGPRVAWGLLGVVPLVTGALGICPLYRALGVTSVPTGHRELHAH